MYKIVDVSQRAIQIGKVVTMSAFTVTAFTARLKLFYRPFRSNHFSSKFNVLDIVIGPIKRKAVQSDLHITQPYVMIFLEFME
jgi:sensor histidine kinase YesM